MTTAYFPNCRLLVPLLGFYVANTHFLSPTSKLTAAQQIKKMELDLLNFCKRAVGEFCLIYHDQGQLSSVAYNVGILDHFNGQFPVYMGHSQIPYDITSIPIEKARVFKANVITVREALYPDRNNDQRSPYEKPSPDFKLQGTVTPLKRFIAPVSPVDSKWLSSDPSALAFLSEGDKAELYWGVRLFRHGCDVVMGILLAIPSLKKMGYKHWILPNGDKIPLAALKLGVADIIPNKPWLIGADVFRADEIYFEGVNRKDTSCGIPDIPIYSMEKVVAREPRVHSKGIHPDHGLLFDHCFLEFKLPSGEVYVVDPTARQFGIKGKHRSLIVHCPWKEYVDNFPGFITKLTVNGEVYSQQMFNANGPRTKNADRLKAALLKYFERRICGYCGIIEGLHPENPKFEFYDFKNTVLYNCTGCGKVAYCSPFCQKQDWKIHKADCGAKNAKKEQLPEQIQVESPDTSEVAAALEKLSLILPDDIQSTLVTSDGENLVEVEK